ncbi:MAG: MFS transporter [Gammaproteobacteria bacterium]|nr:MFS transporter [Gammaproteobacteria bacterium]
MTRRPVNYYAAGFLALGLVPLSAVIVPLYALGLGASAGQVGIIMAMRSLLPFLMAIPGGAMMDRYGVRFMVSRLSAACAVLALVYPLADGFWPLLVLQLVFGLCQSFCWIGVQTGIGKSFKGDSLITSHLGFWSMGGTFIGPLMIGVVWDYLGSTSSFVTVSAWCALLMFLALSLDEQKSPTEGVKSSRRQQMGSDYGEAFRLLKEPIVFFVIASSSVRLGAVALQTSFLPVYLAELSFSASQIGLVIGVSAASSAVSAFLNNVMARWWQPERILAVFILIALLALTSMSATSSFWALMALNVLMGIAIGTTQPAMFSVLGARIPSEIQGLIVGLRTSMNRMATFVIPLAAGVAAELAGTRYTFVWVGLLLITLWALTQLKMHLHHP